MIILNKQSKNPYYVQISLALETMITNGYFKHGAKLPTLTEMRDMFNISLKVAAQVYDDLNQKGYIYSRRGKGYYVSFYKKLDINLKRLYELESELIYEKKMDRIIIVFEKTTVNPYIEEQLGLKEDEKCYHVKQYYGKKNHNVLLQDVYLPEKYFPNLKKRYEDYFTIPSLIMNGYRYAMNQFSYRFYPSQATIEHEVFLQLNIDQPLWRIETLCIGKDDQPICMINQYGSGQNLTMAVSLDVN